MIPLTQEEHYELVRRAADALSNFQPGEDAIAVLSRIYRQNLPDKSPRQGETMAKELVSWMARFQEGYDAALSDPAGFARHTLTRELQDMPLEDQCRTLHRLLQQEKGLTPTDFTGPATAHTRDDLLEETVRFLTTHTDLPPTPNEDYALRQQVMQHCGGDMSLAAIAMILYTMAKNGELSGVPRNLTLSQAAIIVCTNDTQCQLLCAQASGYITHARAQMLMQTLSLTFRTLWLAIVIPLTVSAFLVEGALAITAGGVITLAAMALLTSVAFQEFDKMLTSGAAMIAEVPLSLDAFRSMPAENASRSHTSADVSPFRQNLPDAAEEEDEEEDFQSF